MSCKSGRAASCHQLLIRLARWPTVEPYLRELQSVEPLDCAVPFQGILPLDVAHPLPKLAAPTYTLVPGFRWSLNALLDEAGREDDARRFEVADVEAVKASRLLLREHSRLDPSQADAVMDCLTSSMALVQVSFDVQCAS